MAAFDAQGTVTGAALDLLLTEIGEQLNSPAWPNGPALLALACIDWKACGTGTQIAIAVKKILRAVDAGLIDCDDTHGHTQAEELQQQASNKSTPIIRALRPDPHPGPLQQTFDQSAIIKAFRSLAASGNLDSGGGLALLLESLQRHLSFAVQSSSGVGLPECQARALNRPRPLVVAAFIRRAVVKAM